MVISIQTKEADIPLRRAVLGGISGQAVPFDEREIRIQHEQIGSLTDTQITTGNFFITHYNLLPTRPVKLVRELEEDIIQLDFMLQGNLQAPADPAITGHTFSSGQHNISYFPPSRSVCTYYPSDQPQDHMVVVMLRDVYYRLIPSGSGLHRVFDTRIAQRQAGYCCPENLLITPAMNRLIRDIRSSQRTGPLKRLFLESRVTELLLLQLEQMQDSQPPVLLPKQVDTLKIGEAHQRLDADYRNPPTIIELAKLVGLNESTLKRGFKAQFNTTILGYITQRRMEDARQFLLEGNKTISEISYWVGYKNPAHFTVAFKRYFGLLPGAVRKKAGRDAL